MLSRELLLPSKVYKLPLREITLNDIRDWGQSKVTGMQYVKDIYRILAWPCADLESFVRGGPALTTFFELMRGGRIEIPL